MGVVYRAYDVTLRREIALKLIGSELDSRVQSHLRDRLRREAYALAQLKHPNAVTLYDLGSFGDETYIAMELVEGDTARVGSTREARLARDRSRLRPSRASPGGRARGRDHPS
jgi:serine/threonine protein kinase